MTRWMISALMALQLSAVSMLSGCAAVSGFGGKSAETAPVDEAAILRARVQARWDAFLQADFERVYSFATPTYRKSFGYEHFSNQYAMQIRRTGIEIYKHQFDPADPSVAKVVVLLSFISEGAVGAPYEGVSRVVETWVKQEGKWWYVEPR